MVRDDIDRTHSRTCAHNMHGKDKEGHTWWSIGCGKRCIECPTEVRCPPSINSVEVNRASANGRIQKLQLFIRGSAISGAPIIIGIIQLANPTKARHNRPEHHNQAMHGHLIKNSGLTICNRSKSSARITSANTPPVNMAKLNHQIH